MNETVKNIHEYLRFHCNIIFIQNCYHIKKLYPQFYLNLQSAFIKLKYRLYRQSSLIYYYY